MSELNKENNKNKAKKFPGAKPKQDKLEPEVMPMYGEDPDK